MSEGHPEARRYPLPMLAHEVAIARDRINRQHVTNAVLTQGAIISAIDKQGAKEFQKQIKRLSRGW